MILKFTDMVKIDNKCWMIGNNINALYCYDLSTKQIVKRADFKSSWNCENGCIKMGIFLSIRKVGELLVLIPHWANEIAVYDIRQDKFDYCGFLDGYGIPYSVAYLGYTYNNYLYFAIRDSRKLFRFDVEKKLIQEINILDRLNIDTVSDDCEFFWNLLACIDDNIIYLPINNTNCVVEYDIQFDKLNMHRIGEEAIYDISAENGDIWITTVEGTIIRWNINKGEKFRYRAAGDDLYLKKEYRLYIHEGYTYVLGIYSNNDILKISHDDNKVTRVKSRLVDATMRYKDDWIRNFSCMNLKSHEQFGFQLRTGEFCIAESFQDESLEIEKPIELSDTPYQLYGKSWFGENRGYDLSDYIMDVGIKGFV